VLGIADALAAAGVQEVEARGAGAADGGILDPIIIFVNCDGPVAIDGIGVTPELLSNWTANGPHRETNHYTFKSQNGCFGSLIYDVTWSLVRWDGALAGWLNLRNVFYTMSVSGDSYRVYLLTLVIVHVD